MSAELETAIAHHRVGNRDAARRAARDGLSRHPEDVPLLHFLGMVEMQGGDPTAARALLEQAVALDPLGPPLVSLARLFARARDWAALAALGPAVPHGAAGDEYLALRIQGLAETRELDSLAEALLALSERRPDERDLARAAARALADAGRLDRAEIAYRALLATEPSDEQALLGMTGLLESLGRSGELEAYFDAARAAGTGQALSSLGQAIARRECGDFAGALSAIERAVSILPVGTWHQMRGELADRAGDPDTAFAAFAQMNAADAAAHPDAPEGVRRFRASLDASLAALDRPVRVEPAGEREPPLFLVGFPRSGTTLLDTFLLGHPGIEVHEERPFLDHAAALLEDGATEPGAAEVAHMRAAYWRALDAESTRRDGLHIDKFPLASARALLIHQLFPDARFVLALRHPCDVVLSCFMTRFRLNWGVAAFLSLEDAAKTYARVMRLWIASRERLGLAVLEVRYEEFVADPARVIGQVMDFAGLEDHPAMLDHQFTARRRGLITTPSYAQVLKPVTGQAVGRWKRYRAQIEPALPILEPWCAKFGYSIDD